MAGCLTKLLNDNYRNTLLKGVHNFVHLNLSIALFLALTVFVAGIDTATGSKVNLL